MPAPVAIDVRELEQLLRQRASTLAPLLLPNGRWYGKLWRTGSIADDPGQSLAVYTDGGREGTWSDFALLKNSCPEANGDMLKLIALTRFRGNLGEAVKWGISWLGLDGLDPGRLATHKAQAAVQAQRRDDDAATKAEKMKKLAKGLWIGARPIEGTPAELYLAARGIDLSSLPRISRSLRYAERCWNAELDMELPALVACVNGPDSKQVATHRIWIESDGQGYARKHSALSDPKMVLGPYWGGHIPINKGEHDCPLRDLPRGVTLWISEGIEDGLSIACAMPELRIVAGVTLGGIGAMVLPDHVDTVGIIAQNDPPGSLAEASLAKAIAAHQAKGRRVLRAVPPIGVKDSNDLLRGVAA